MEKIPQLLDSLLLYIPDSSLSNTKASQSTIGWQIEHSILVVEQIIQTLKESPISKSLSFPKPLWYMIKIKGSFPRGKAQAPTSVRPPEIIHTDTFQRRIEHLKLELINLGNLSPKVHFTHSLFGTLNLKESKKFLFMHTMHHLKIIEEIKKQDQ